MRMVPIASACVFAATILALPRSLPAQGESKSAPSTPLYRIGVLCPLEGRFAPLGESFLRGASIALKEARLKGVKNTELVVGDTRGNPLESRAAAERLIHEERVDAILGEVLSSSTIAAAQVAELSRTVFLSPVATEEGISDMGDWVFQTSLGSEVEIAALARMACERLELHRIAFMSSDDLRSRSIALLFEDEVERLGGELCIAEFYPEGSTDFSEAIGRLRSTAPEALFIASDTEDLILILPQLSFHEFGVQLLGSSIWNSRRLIRMVGKDLEGALFSEDVDTRTGERLFATACTLVNEPAGELNQVVVGGYRGTKLLIEAINRSRSGGEPLRNELSRRLEKKRHPFLDLISGEGILFYTVRNETAVEFDTLKIAR